MRNYYWLLILLACLAVTIPSAISSPFTITGDNFLIEGVNFTEQVFVENSVNGTFTNCSFTTDGLITVNSTEINAPYNYWGTPYAPDANISIDVVITPWFTTEDLNTSSTNYKPVITTITDKTGNVGSLFTFTVSCVDANNDSLVFSDNTTLFVIGSSTGLISFTPLSTIVEKIRIQCSDGEYAEYKDFKLTILPKGVGYNARYEPGDISASFIDIIVGGGAILFSFVTLIVIIFGYFAYRRWK